MIPSGSITCLIVFIKFTVPAPSSSTKNSLFPIPTPCSPVPTNDMLERPLLSGGKGAQKLTSSVERECALDHAVHQAAHDSEFLVRLECQKGMEVPCE